MKHSEINGDRLMKSLILSAYIYTIPHKYSKKKITILKNLGKILFYSTFYILPLERRSPSKYFQKYKNVKI